jgi:hypothetical protein
VITKKRIFEVIDMYISGLLCRCNRKIVNGETIVTHNKKCKGKQKAQELLKFNE